MTPILVTGCGRSGTQFIAGVLRGLGIACSHETVYNHDLDPRSPEVGGQIARRWEGWRAEASWLAAPFLCRTDPPPVVWHQVRHPLKVIACWTSHKLMTGDVEGVQLIRKVVPECGVGGLLGRTAAYWLRWNEMVDNWGSKVGKEVGGYWRYRVEDLTAEHLHCLLKLSGWSVLLGEVRRAMQDSDTRSCGPHAPVTWAEIGELDCGAELLEMARRYGYEVQA